MITILATLLNIRRAMVSTKAKSRESILRVFGSRNDSIVVPFDNGVNNGHGQVSTGEMAWILIATDENRLRKKAS